MSFEVRYAYDEAGASTNIETFDTFEEAKDFADWMREDMQPHIRGGFVEFDEIAAFAKAIELEAKAQMIKDVYEPNWLLVELRRRQAAKRMSQRGWRRG